MSIMDLWQWPQYLVAVVMMIGVATHAVKHGEPVDMKYNWFARVTVAGITTFVLYCGGFFQ